MRMGQVVAVHRVRHTPYVRVEKGTRWPMRVRVTSIHGSAYFVRTKNISFVPQPSSLAANETEDTPASAVDVTGSERVRAESQENEGRRELRLRRERGLYRYIEWLIEQEQTGRLLEGDVALKLSGDTREVLLNMRYKID